jgi:hypothetical protein
MKIIGLVFCTIISFGCFAKSSEPLPSIAVQVPANYAQDADIPPKVRAECMGLETLTGQLIVDMLKNKKYAASYAVDEVNDASIGIALRAQIVGITATPGGGWSGGKTMVVKAELFQDGILVDSAVRSRSSKGGLFGAVKGNCDILERDAEALAADIYVWLVRLTKSKTLPVQLIANPTNASASSSDVASAESEGAAASTEPSAATSAPSLPIANKSIFIRTPAVYAQTANIRREILNECHLDSALTNYAQEIFSVKVPNSTGLTSSADTRDKDILEFTILAATGDAGGTASGSKSMTVRAQLLRNDTVIDQYENTRSAGNAFGPMKGTCTILVGVARALAADSANWYLKRAATHSNDKQPSTESASTTAGTEAN